ncbi:MULTISPECIES: class I SAM-dependent methyltransferase [Mycobacterium]|uniref:SAM-dependent methyltransferase n=2 Tax=Mycobacterium TaxID=1763 RepID=A0A1W9ZCK1_MYCAN|nr:MULTISPECIES: class I SAM-dependent methyltransferase [Mycobacterium]MCV7074469.1 methyltransferase domain-containing protein [Mycobacterium szulgai]MCV7195607.1 methyltransferase domain-containing protein [Mycobacterium angelicum]ORA11691.1 SAM-dependent methyltransferase [Mycobacterium angelicum]ORX11418.1 methyltransferase [Mycobacterium szulgai]
MSQCYCHLDSDTARTADGSLVDLYRRMPPTGEPEQLHALLPPGSSVLELGAGTGRIADPLAQLGHRVTAVDDSALMLAEVRHARPVRARIEDLRLAEQFDAVLLATNLIHYRGADLRRAVLAAIAHHLKPTGKAVIQWKPPPYWTARPTGWTESKAIGEVTVSVTIHRNSDGLVDGEYALIVDESELRQCFHLEVLALEDIVGELDRAGLQLTSVAPESTEWLEVVHSG